MSWDFSTEPEFQAQLDWMREFVKEEIWPLETLLDEIGHEGLVKAMVPLQEQVRQRGLWRHTSTTSSAARALAKSSSD